MKNKEKKQFLEIGRIVGTHALKGEVRVDPWADSGEFLLGFKRMYFGGNQPKAAPVDIQSARVHKNIVILKIRGVDNVSEADALRGRVLYVNRKDVRLPKGRYFIEDLIGLRILDAGSGALLGILADVSKMPANEVYHVRTEDGAEHLVPAIDSVIAETNPDEGYIKINVIKGMF